MASCRSPWIDAPRVGVDVSSEPLRLERVPEFELLLLPWGMVCPFVKVEMNVLTPRTCVMSANIYTFACKARRLMRL